MLDFEPKVKEKAGYSRKTAAMTWQGKQPDAFHAGLLEFQENYKKDPVGALSTLSSVYYSYASHRMRNDRSGSLFRKVVVTLHAAWLLFQAMRVSDRMVKEAGGLEKLSANQLDVRQTILRRCGRLGAAKKTINVGIDKLRPDGKLHAELLLGIGQADICARRGELSAAVHIFRDISERVVGIHEMATSSADYRQLARICRNLEEHFLALNCPKDAAEMRDTKEWATRIAENLEAMEGVG